MSKDFFAFWTQPCLQIAYLYWQSCIILFAFFHHDINKIDSETIGSQNSCQQKKEFAQETNSTCCIVPCPQSGLHSSPTCGVATSLLIKLNVGVQLMVLPHLGIVLWCHFGSKLSPTCGIAPSWLMEFDGGQVVKILDYFQFNLLICSKLWYCPSAIDWAWELIPTCGVAMSLKTIKNTYCKRGTV